MDLEGVKERMGKMSMRSPTSDYIELGTFKSQDKIVPIFTQSFFSEFKNFSYTTLVASLLHGLLTFMRLKLTISSKPLHKVPHSCMVQSLGLT